ncbi:hypothetical protein M501DRAFT_1014974 [Patellaria atrata CBS 101060]|uniref:Uncharacterized protein n=1 Tax=Patellaria atrata CBS 101060 TaxID=1346257 RepID=A0A9P4VPL9_9PEZI|nr:hypothetical protein M501DRAFT_1014974 [Patellaria atrata CBS 101060]
MAALTAPADLINRPFSPPILQTFAINQRPLLGSGILRTAEGRKQYNRERREKKHAAIARDPKNNSEEQQEKLREKLRKTQRIYKEEALSAERRKGVHDGFEILDDIKPALCADELRAFAYIQRVNMINTLKIRSDGIYPEP